MLERILIEVDAWINLFLSNPSYFLVHAFVLLLFETTFSLIGKLFSSKNEKSTGSKEETKPNSKEETKPNSKEETKPKNNFFYRLYKFFWGATKITAGFITIYVVLLVLSVASAHHENIGSTDGLCDGSVSVNAEPTPTGSSSQGVGGGKEELPKQMGSSQQSDKLDEVKNEMNQDKQESSNEVFENEIIDIPVEKVPKGVSEKQLYVDASQLIGAREVCSQENNRYYRVDFSDCIIMFNSYQENMIFNMITDTKELKSASIRVKMYEPGTCEDKFIKSWDYVYSRDSFEVMIFKGEFDVVFELLNEGDVIEKTTSRIKVYIDGKR